MRASLHIPLPIHYTQVRWDHLSVQMRKVLANKIVTDLIAKRRH